MTIKTILDSNVIISGIFWKGASFEILKAWQEHRFRLAITLPILNEYRRVLDEMTKKHPLPVLSSILEVFEPPIFFGLQKTNCGPMPRTSSS